MLPKPDQCRPCPIYGTGQGFVPAHGPIDAPLLFIGEAAGKDEARRGVPMVGQAGGQFDRTLYLLDMERSVDARVHNILSCQPPGNKLLKTAYEDLAIHQCKPYVAETVATGQHKAIVALGAIATRELTGIRTKQENLHGTVHVRESGQIVVPTYHPSHIQRGQKNLTWVMLQDIAKARRIAREGFQKRPSRLVVDPSPADFEAWADRILESEQEVWLATDIETPYKQRKEDEGAVSLRDPGRTILRINFACHPDEGWTVPWEGPFVTIAKRLLAAAHVVKVFWNETYDVPILEFNGALVEGTILDAMDACHFLQGDVPRGLGFWAPFYSDYGAWKHLAHSAPAEYAAIDGLQTERVILGAAKELAEAGLWDTYIRHFVLTAQYMYRPSSRAGVLIDVENLPAFRDELQEKADSFLAELRSKAPDEVRHQFPRNVAKREVGWKKDPGPTKDFTKTKGKEDWGILPVEKTTCEAMTRLCRTCREVGVANNHQCKTTRLAVLEGKLIDKPDVVQERAQVPRWFVREPFNPGSSEQVIAYMRHFGHKIEIDKDTRKPTASRLAIEKRAKDTPEIHRPFYNRILDFREVAKVKSTYVDASLNRIAFDRSIGIETNRLCPQVTNKPSTFRTAYVNPNLQNVVADKRGKKSLAAGFRRYVMAAPGCSLIEADYAGIEAVVTGWLAEDPDYIRLAKLSVHAYLTSHLIGQPADLSWSNEKLLEYFAWIKAAWTAEYDRAKRVVHGTNYGLTPWGMAERFPETFPKVSLAMRAQELYFQIAPKLKAWQNGTRERAVRDNHLGGMGKHPFNYRHWFWGVYDYAKITKKRYHETLARAAAGKRAASVVEINGNYYSVGLGEDAKRCIAFGPQSIAAGVIKECGLRLFRREEPVGTYIGELGPPLETPRGIERHPLRALIHDSFFLEVRDECIELALAALRTEMTRPVEQLPCPEEWGIGPYLSFGCEIKVGKRWSEMEVVSDDAAADTIVEPYDEPEIEDEEDVA